MHQGREAGSRQARVWHQLNLSDAEAQERVLKTFVIETQEIAVVLGK